MRGLLVEVCMKLGCAFSLPINSSQASKIVLCLLLIFFFSKILGTVSINCNPQVTYPWSRVCLTALKNNNDKVYVT